MKIRLVLATVYGVIAFILAFIAAGCMDGTETLEVMHIKLLVAGGLFAIISLIEIHKIVSLVKVH